MIPLNYLVVLFAMWPMFKRVKFDTKSLHWTHTRGFFQGHRVLLKLEVVCHRIIKPLLAEGNINLIKETFSTKIRSIVQVHHELQWLFSKSYISPIFCNIESISDIVLRYADMAKKTSVQFQNLKSIWNRWCPIKFNLIFWLKEFDPV